MDPDNYQQAWQAQSAQMRVTVYTDFLLKDMQRDLRYINNGPFRQSCIHLGTAIVMMVFFAWYFGTKWVWYPEPLFWIFSVLIGINLVNLWRSSGQELKVSDSLIDCLQDLVSRYDQQIRQARESFKGLFVVAIAGMIFMHLLLGVPHMVGFGVLMAVACLLLECVLRFNAVPKKQRLSALLSSLRDEPIPKQ